jgi:hypothetical protein
VLPHRNVKVCWLPSSLKASGGCALTAQVDCSTGTVGVAVGAGGNVGTGVGVGLGPGVLVGVGLGSGVPVGSGVGVGVAIATPGTHGDVASVIWRGCVRVSRTWKRPVFDRPPPPDGATAEADAEG